MKPKNLNGNTFEGAVNMKIDVIIRNLEWFREGLQKKMGTQFEPNITDKKKISSQLQTIAKKSSDLQVRL